MILLMFKKSTTQIRRIEKVSSNLNTFPSDFTWPNLKSPRFKPALFGRNPRITLSAYSSATKTNPKALALMARTNLLAQTNPKTLVLMARASLLAQTNPKALVLMARMSLLRSTALEE